MKKRGLSKDARKAVFGIFDTESSVSKAVSQLKAQGFRNTDISVLMPTESGTQHFAQEKHTKAPEGASRGAATGALLGGGLGWLVGLGALAIPGVGPFVAAGPIMSALAGAGIGGTVGGIAGALIGMGIPEYEAKRYESMVHEGGILISVHVDDAQWERQAKRLLQNTGARDIASAGEVTQPGVQAQTHVVSDRDDHFTGEAGSEPGLKLNTPGLRRDGWTDERKSGQ